MELIIYIITHAIELLFGNSDDFAGDSAYNLVHKLMYDKIDSLLASDSMVMRLVSDMVGVGICFCVIFWLVNILKTMNYKDITPELLLRTFIRMFIGFVLISNFTSYIPQMNVFADKFTEEVKDGFVKYKLFVITSTDEDSFTSDSHISSILDSKFGTQDALEETEEYLSNNTSELEDTSSMTEEELAEYNDKLTHTDTSYFRMLQAIIEMIAFQLILHVFDIVIIIVSFTRTLNLARKCLFAPFALANVYGEGSQNQAFKYLREIFAICMQEPIVYIILMIGTYLISVANVGLIATVVLITGTMSLIFKSKSISEQIFV